MCQRRRKSLNYAIGNQNDVDGSGKKYVFPFIFIDYQYKALNFLSQ